MKVFSRPTAAARMSSITGLGVEKKPMPYLKWSGNISKKAGLLLPLRDNPLEGQPKVGAIGTLVRSEPHIPGDAGHLKCLGSVSRSLSMALIERFQCLYQLVKGPFKVIQILNGGPPNQPFVLLMAS